MDLVVNNIYKHKQLVAFSVYGSFQLIWYKCKMMIFYSLITYANTSIRLSSEFMFVLLCIMQTT